MRAYLRSSPSLKGCPPRPEGRGAGAGGRRSPGVDRRDGPVIQNLSKGYRQRVGIAQALLGLAAGADPRRAHRGPRSRASAPRCAQLIKGLAGQAHGHPLHPHPPGGHDDLRAGAHHQPGADGGLRRDPEPGPRAGPGRPDARSRTSSSSSPPPPDASSEHDSTCATRWPSPARSCASTSPRRGPTWSSPRWWRISSFFFVGLLADLPGGAGARPALYGWSRLPPESGSLQEPHRRRRRPALGRDRWSSPSSSRRSSPCGCSPRRSATRPSSC